MYKLEFSRSAYKALIKLPKNIGNRIRAKLELLARDPMAPNHDVKKLKNCLGYRLRVGHWRVIYRIEHKAVVIHVIKISPRDQAYENH